MKRIILSVVIVLGLGLTQAREKKPEIASVKNAAESVKKEFAFIAPGEGRSHFMINEAFPEENNAIFKWSPKTVGAVLCIKADDKVLDEITVKNTDHISLNLTKYGSYKSVTWFLTVSESDTVMKGVIDLRKYVSPFEFNVVNCSIVRIFGLNYASNINMLYNDQFCLVLTFSEQFTPYTLVPDFIS